MPAEKPTDRLAREHKVIQKVVAAMVGLADRIEMGGEVSRETLTDVVRFMHAFADRIHEEKEESFFFPLLEKNGLSIRSCPLRMLVREHQLGRSLVTRLAENADAYHAGDQAATHALVDSLRRLTDLYPLHIWREDLVLFPKANDALSPEDNERLLEDFQSVDQAIEEGTAEEVLARYEQLAERIDSQAR